MKTFFSVFFSLFFIVSIQGQKHSISTGFEFGNTPYINKMGMGVHFSYDYEIFSKINISTEIDAMHDKMRTYSKCSVCIDSEWISTIGMNGLFTVDSGNKHNIRLGFGESMSYIKYEYGGYEVIENDKLYLIEQSTKSVYAWMTNLVLDGQYFITKSHFAGVKSIFRFPLKEKAVVDDSHSIKGNFSVLVGLGYRF